MLLEMLSAMFSVDGKCTAMFAIEVTEENDRQGQPLDGLLLCPHLLLKRHLVHMEHLMERNGPPDSLLRLEFSSRQMHHFQRRGLNATHGRFVLIRNSSFESTPCWSLDKALINRQDGPTSTPFRFEKHDP
jgi:hypothetical protein